MVTLLLNCFIYHDLLGCKLVPHPQVFAVWKLEYLLGHVCFRSTGLSFLKFLCQTRSSLKGHYSRWLTLLWFFYRLASGFDLSLLLLQADVNTVCFADESGHLIYSGSDDSLCKVNSPTVKAPGIYVFDYKYFHFEHCKLHTYLLCKDDIMLIW